MNPPQQTRRPSHNTTYPPPITFTTTNPQYPTARPVESGSFNIHHTIVPPPQAKYQVGESKLLLLLSRLNSHLLLLI